MPKKITDSECEIHKKPCQYVCTSSKCDKSLICQKCRRQHLQRHPAHFIHQLANIAEIHAFSKIDKLKQTLIKEKYQQQKIIKDIFYPFENLITPLTDKIKQFYIESRQLIQQQLASYLRSNKLIIEQTQKKIVKSNTQQIKNNPKKMLEQTINEVETINKRQSKLLENGDSYKQYSDRTKKLCQNLAGELTSMIKVGMRIIENSLKLQRNKFLTDGLQIQNSQDTSFYKRYPTSTKIEYQRHILEAEVLKSKNAINWKQKEVQKANMQIRQKVIKIQQLQEKVEGLKQELIESEQQAQIKNKQRLKQLERQAKKKSEVLIKNGIVGSNGKSISLQRKIIVKEDLPLILQIVPNPSCLDLSNHKMREEDLQIFFSCSSIQTLKFNFSRVRQELLINFFKHLPNLQQLQLNSAEIDDNVLINLSKQFPPKIRVLYLIDNKITDEGLESMFKNMNRYGQKQSHNDKQKIHSIDQLYISYNKLTQKSIEIISQYSYQIKKLHIAKNQLKGKGGQNIGKFLKDLEELFVGATGLNKDAFLAIVRNCLRLKKLSLVANEVSTQIVTEILLGLHQLKWLDISYCNLTKSDLEKIEKLKIFNKDLQIISSN